MALQMSPNYQVLQYKREPCERQRVEAHIWDKADDILLAFSSAQSLSRVRLNSRRLTALAAPSHRVQAYRSLSVYESTFEGRSFTYLHPTCVIHDTRLSPSKLARCQKKFLPVEACPASRKWLPNSKALVIVDRQSTPSVVRCPFLTSSLSFTRSSSQNFHLETLISRARIRSIT